MLNVIIALGGLVSAIAAVVSAYFSLQSAKTSSDVARKVASIQAIYLWSDGLQKHNKAGACIQAIVNSDNREDLMDDLVQSPLNRVIFNFPNNQKNDTAVYNCIMSVKEMDGTAAERKSLRDSIRSRISTEKKYQLDGDESRNILEKIYGYSNSYNSVLSLIYTDIGDKKFICAEIKPSFDRAMYDFIDLMKIIEAKRHNEKAKLHLINSKSNVSFQENLAKNANCNNF